MIERSHQSLIYIYATTSQNNAIIILDDTERGAGLHAHIYDSTRPFILNIFGKVLQIAARAPRL